MIKINYAKYGDTEMFDTLEEAQTCIRDCGPEWDETVLRLSPWGRVLNEQDEVVGMEVD